LKGENESTKEKRWWLWWESQRWKRWFLDTMIDSEKNERTALWWMNYWENCSPRVSRIRGLWSLPGSLSWPCIAK
jgi:hypothetical protein